MKNNKKMVIPLTILILTVTIFGYGKYKDWDNAQLIKGMARDFPALISEIEVATGLELEVRTNCMKTQEKFSDGVKTCEFLTTYKNVDSDVLGIHNKTLDNQNKFSKSSEFKNNEGFYFKYRNKEICQFAYQKGVYLSCVVGVRNANSDVQEVIENN